MPTIWEERETAGLVKEPLKIAGKATAMAVSVGTSAELKVVMMTFDAELWAWGTFVKPGSVHDTAKALKTMVAAFEKRSVTAADGASNSALIEPVLATLVQTMDPKET
jgi:hypothetical protein